MPLTCAVERVTFIKLYVKLEKLISFLKVKEAVLRFTTIFVAGKVVFEGVYVGAVESSLPFHRCVTTDFSVFLSWIIT